MCKIRISFLKKKIIKKKGEGFSGSHKYSSTDSSLEHEIVRKPELRRMRWTKKHIKYRPCS